MRDYFKYDVQFVMNVTDVDDKIIRKANEVKQEFTYISRKFEEDFLSDMEALNVESPNVLTRVSEYIPEIVDYIKTIIDNGYAYESNGSVYFNIDNFKASNMHTYAKLDPSKVGNDEALQEGEGVLTETENNDKKSKQDFALWKKSKPGEPFWDSPWG